MKKLLFCTALMCGVAALANAQLIIDDFEADSSANYTLVGDGTPDYTANFQFDYVAAGIPLAPRSSPGDQHGLRFTANDLLGATDSITAFHNTAITEPSYYLLVDIWMGVTGTGGTTEYAQVGVGGDGTTFNSLFSPISGSGSFLAMTGEGGSSSDYRWFADGVPVNSGDDSYQSDAKTTNASDPLYQAIFPGGDFPGSPGNRWTTLRIDVDGSNLTYSLDGTPIVIGTATLDGDRVSLGYADLFTSLAVPLQSQFGIYDNLVVAVPEPSALALALIGGAGFLFALRRRKQ